MMKMKGIIFDLDGTLSDTAADLCAALNTSLLRFGRKPITETQLKAFVGNGAKNLVIRALGGDENDPIIPDILDDYRETYSANLVVKTHPYDGMINALETFSAHDFSLAVVSNKPDSQTKALVSHCFPSVSFSSVTGKRDGIPLKPDPFSALEAAKIMGALPENVTFVGDSPEDFLTAQNAGMPCVSVLWGYRERSAFSGLPQTRFVSTPSELVCEILKI